MICCKYCAFLRCFIVSDNVVVIWLISLKPTTFAPAYTSRVRIHTFNNIYNNISMKHLVFVYGTLRYSYHNHALLSTSTIIGSGRTKDMFVMSSRSIPFVSRSQKVSTIFGEVYSVTPDVLKSLDSLESYDPSSPDTSWYTRELIDINLEDGSTVQAFCYFNEQESASIIASGDFSDASSFCESSDDIWYFAYGSNKNPQRMFSRGVTFTRRIAGILDGFSLDFNKIAGPPGEGYANIMPSVDSEAQGALYRFPASDLWKLDAAEGVSSGHYFREKFEVLTDDGPVLATCYIACDDQVAYGLTPSPSYLAHLACGDDLLGSV